LLYFLTIQNTTGEMVNCLSLIKVGVVKLMKEIKVPDTAILRQEMRDPTNDVHREEMPGMMR